MKSSKTKIRIQAAVIIAATAVVAAGCCTKGQTSANKQPAPVVEAGAPPVEVQTEAGTSAGNMVIPLQKEQLQVGTQQVPDGTVKIRKYVKTETVSQPVTVRSESVSIERVPPGAAPPTGSQAATDLNKPFQGGEVVINLNKEQPVVSTQVVPNGSVVVNKQESSSTVNVQGQVRSEDVAAVPSGNQQNVHITGNLAPAPGEAAGAPPSPAYQSGGAGAGQQITQLEQLTSSPDPTTMAGQQVQLSSVPVQKVAGPHLIIIGSAGGAPIYVHSAQPTSGISPGQMVNVNGTVQSATSSQGWDAQSSQAIQGQKIFIDATSVAPANQ